MYLMHDDGLMQNRGSSSALTMELYLFCFKPLMYKQRCHIFVDKYMYVPYEEI